MHLDLRQQGTSPPAMMLLSLLSSLLIYQPLPSPLPHTPTGQGINTF